MIRPVAHFLLIFRPIQEHVVSYLGASIEFIMSSSCEAPSLVWGSVARGSWALLGSSPTKTGASYFRRLSGG